MALGAERGHVVQMVVRQGAEMAAAGIAVGILASLGLNRWMESLLYGVNANDPATFAVIAAIMAVTALLACCGPARKASLVDPLSAIRHE